MIRPKTFSAFVLIMLGTVVPGFASLAETAESDRILGAWLNAPGDGLIRIDKAGEVYFGRIQPDQAGGAS